MTNRGIPDYCAPPVAVALVTDTTHYLPRPMVAAKGLHEVSLYVKFEGRQIRESEMLDNFDEFYDKLRTAQEMPTTSQPSIGDFLAVWEPLLNEGKDIVSMHLASGISGTYGSALQAKNRLVEDGLDEARLCVVDAKTGAGGTAMMLLAGAARAPAGGGRGGARAGRQAARWRRWPVESAPRANRSGSGSSSRRSSTCAAAAALAQRPPC